MAKSLYVAVHNHDYGADAKLFRAAHAPSEEEVVAFFGFDFEPERGEYIDISIVNEDDIKELN